MPPSAGACQTTDAALNPDCGRAGPRSSIMTAIGWRAATSGGTRTPVSGAGTGVGVGTGGGVGMGVDSGVGVGSGVGTGVGVTVGDGFGAPGGLAAPATWDGSTVDDAVPPAPATSAPRPRPPITATSTRTATTARLIGWGVPGGPGSLPPTGAGPGGGR